MYELIVNSCNEEVKLLSTHSLKEILESSAFGKRYIPSLKIKEKGNPKANLEVKISNDFEIKGNFPNLKYSGKSMIDVLVLSEYMLERLRQENNKYSIHSSSVEKNGKGIVFFGWKDSGKTTLSLMLSQKYGFNFLSEGKTVIDGNLNVVGCIHSLESNKEFIQKNFGNEILNELPLSNQAKVKMFIYPQITFENLKIENWNNEMGDFHLYENFSWKIRAANARINDFSHPLSSLDTFEIAKRRSDFVKKTIGEVEIYHLRGNPEDICKKVEELIEK